MSEKWWNTRLVLGGAPLRGEPILPWGGTTYLQISLLGVKHRKIFACGAHVLSWLSISIIIIYRLHNEEPRMNDALFSWRITAAAFFPWGSSAINRFLGRETPYIIGGYSLQITLLRVKQRTHISFAALIYKSGWISSPNNHPWAPSQLPIESLSSQYDGDVMRSPRHILLKTSWGGVYDHVKT